MINKTTIILSTMIGGAVAYVTLDIWRKINELDTMIEGLYKASEFRERQMENFTREINHGRYNVGKNLFGKGTEES